MNTNEGKNADVVTATDYYPFGTLMPGRIYKAAGGYRYGFNGKENDVDVKGDGNQYDYGFRIYDSRIGKFLSIDPLTKSYPWYTPYQFAGNKPISCIDLDGLEQYNKVGNLQLDLTDPNTIWVGSITTAYVGKQAEALRLSSSNPSKLAVLQQESYNSVVSKVSEIVLKHFDPNVRWDLQMGYTDKISTDLSSSKMLESDEVSNYNSYTDYSTPGQLVSSGTTISSELVSVANTLIIQFARDKVFNNARNTEAIEKESDPNMKMALIIKMEEDNHRAMINFLAAALIAFTPEGTSYTSSGRSASSFKEFASSGVGIRWNLGEAVVTKSHHNWSKIFGSKTVKLADVEPILQEAVNKGTWKTVDLLRGKGGKIIGEKLEIVQKVGDREIWVTAMKEAKTGKIIVTNGGVR